jgi:hypothetical protein
VIFLSSADGIRRERTFAWSRVCRMTPSATLVYFAFLAVGWIAPSQAESQAQPPDNSQDIIHGTVVNALSHAPVGRALVSSPDNRFATMTDGDGHFEFKLPKAESRNNDLAPLQGPNAIAADFGGVWLAARKPGFMNDNEPSQSQAFPGHELIDTRGADQRACHAFYC